MRHQRHNVNLPAPKALTFMSFLFFVLMLVNALPAGAELVFFTNGRSLSVKGHHVEGSSLVLALRGGGEIVCNAAAVARIEPDEVPYPEEVSREETQRAPDAADASPLTATPQLLADPRYDALITQASARHGIDAALVRAVIQVESNYERLARSRKGARGLMQVMPATARQYGVSNLYDPAANLEAGIRHLKSLLSRFPLSLALAAYNAGEATVQRFGGVPPFEETRSYVARILKLVGRT
jgi:soluble lytic murein transglycosylase-like protein